MHWHSFGDFLGMGGYALYVWGSVGATALVVLAESLQVRARRRAILTELRDALEAANGAAEEGA